MKRDMSLVRDILLRLEPIEAHFDQPISLTVGEGALALEGRSSEEISYHIRIMTQGNLISMGGIDASRFIRFYYGFRWNGNEFLDNVRDPEIWRKTKDRAKIVGGVGLGFLLEIAKAELKIKLGLP